MRLKTAGVLLALVLIGVASTTPAAAEFKAEKEGTTIKLKGTLMNFKVAADKITCEKTTGEGFLAKKEGKTGASESEDAPAAEAVKASAHAAFTLKFEGCLTEIAKVKHSVSVKAEKCQFEFNVKSEGEEKEASSDYLSLRASKAKEACRLLLQVTEGEKVTCELGIAAETANENEVLNELKVKNTAKFASEVNAGSVLAGFEVAKVSGECGLSGAEKEQVRRGESTEIAFSEHLVLEGVEQQGPRITASTEDMNFGAITGKATMAVTQTNNSNTMSWTPDGFGLRSVRLNDVPGGATSVWVVTDGCGGTTVAPGGSCMLKVEFTPVAGMSYRALLQPTDGLPTILRGSRP